MIFAGGLLRLYWDSGPPPAQGDGFPLGLENIAHPNVSVRWGNRKKPEDAPPPETARVDPPQDAVPVPLPLAPKPACAHPTAQSAALRLVTLRTAPTAAAGAPAAAPVPAALCAVPQATTCSAHATSTAAPITLALDADDWTRAALRQRERNRRAAELALRLLDE